jgi:hypothetical protein
LAAGFVFAAVFGFAAGLAAVAAFVFAAPVLPVGLLFAVRVAMVVLPVSTLTRRLRARPE